MAEPIFIAPYFLDYILPFVLVFTLIFAILQRTQILGESNRNVDLMVGLVVGLMLIAFPGPRSLVVVLMPFLAVAAVILLVFMLLYGFIYGKSETDVLSLGVKRTLAVILAIALIGFLIMVSGYWDAFRYYFFDYGSGFYLINGVFLVVIAAAIIAVVRDKGGGSGS